MSVKKALFILRMLKMNKIKKVTEDRSFLKSELFDNDL